jgi:RNA polymerase sigma-70 factor (ECF subfamily)
MAASDARDLASLYAALRDPLQRYLRRQVRDSGAAEDLLHDVFVRVHERAHTLRDKQCIESWVFKIARNAIVDRGRRERIVTSVDAALPTPAPDDDNEAMRALAACVHRCIDYLPEPYREALRLTAFENVSQKELAARCGLTLSGAKSRVQRARRMLAELYRECCDLEFDARGAVIGYVPRDRCRFRDDDCMLE